MIICNARVAFEEPQLTIIFIDTVPVHPVNKATTIDTPYVARVSANVGEIAVGIPVTPFPGVLISARDVVAAIGARHGLDTLRKTGKHVAGAEIYGPER